MMRSSSHNILFILVCVSVLCVNGRINFTGPGELRKNVGSEPLVSIPIRVNDSRKMFHLFAGDNIRTATADFIESNNIDSAMLDGLIKEVRKRVGNVANLALKSTSRSKQGEKSSGDEEFTMDLTFTVPLVHTVGQNTEQNVRSFCNRHGLDYDQYATALVTAVHQKLIEETQPANSPVQTITNSKIINKESSNETEENFPLITLEIEVDDEMKSLDFYEGESVASAAEAFCLANGLDENSHEEVASVISSALEEL